MNRESNTNSSRIIIHEQIRMEECVRIIEPELSYRLMGVLFKVHSSLGGEYQEKYYQRAVAIALKKAHISFRKEIPVNLSFDGEKIGKYQNPEVLRFHSR